MQLSVYEYGKKQSEQKASDENKTLIREHDWVQDSAFGTLLSFLRISLTDTTREAASLS